MYKCKIVKIVSIAPKPRKQLIFNNIKPQNPPPRKIGGRIFYSNILYFNDKCMYFFRKYHFLDKKVE